MCTCFSDPRLPLQRSQTVRHSPGIVAAVSSTSRGAAHPRSINRKHATQHFLLQFKRAFCKNCSVETARFYIFCTIFSGLSNDIKNVKIGPGGTKCTPPKYDPFYGRVRGGLYQRRPYAGSLRVSPKQSGYL